MEIWVVARVQRIELGIYMMKQDFVLFYMSAKILKCIQMHDNYYVHTYQ